jgi:hypothetical protein
MLNVICSMNELCISFAKNRSFLELTNGSSSGLVSATRWF